MKALADVNGEVTLLGEARISVLDRGFLYGDAVYEVVRVFEGSPFHLEAHLHRLETSWEGLAFENTPPLEELRDRAICLIRESEIREGILYFQVTRGAPESRQTFPDEDTPLTVVLTIEPHTGYGPELFEVGVKVVTREEERWLRADLKTVNLIPRILARREAKAQGAWEVIWASDSGEVLEGGATNVFAVIDGVLWTPPLGERLLAGITRQEVLRCACESGLSVQEKTFHLADMYAAEEVFLTGTTAEVLGVSHVDGQAIGQGKPGPITRELRRLLREVMRREAQEVCPDSTTR